MACGQVSILELAWAQYWFKRDIENRETYRQESIKMGTKLSIKQSNRSTINNFSADDEYNEGGKSSPYSRNLENS
jgi:hypothetical protein